MLKITRKTVWATVDNVVHKLRVLGQEACDMVQVGRRVGRLQAEQLFGLGVHLRDFVLVVGNDNTVIKIFGGVGERVEDGVHGYG